MQEWELSIIIDRDPEMKRINRKSKKRVRDFLNLILFEVIVFFCLAFQFGPGCLPAAAIVIFMITAGYISIFAFPLIRQGRQRVEEIKEEILRKEEKIP